MTHDEIDVLWQRATFESVKAGEAFTRYRFAETVAAAERAACARVCDELGQHWSDYKDSALLNGDIELSNAASGEPRAARAIAAAIRARGEA
ncbi:hypothetical protein [Thauera aromatica]|uniref:hypothetical protein n=1 Tax=Thauera aromatica TaxID=59405 RepID=UPI001FFD0EBB|nr:hypothetical protein [Thauera aromatica]MCK2097246.1 hypothetical protein [Thauera aromatica]